MLSRSQRMGIATLTAVMCLPAFAAAESSSEEGSKPEARQIDDTTWEFPIEQPSPKGSKAGVQVGGCKATVHGPKIINNKLEWGGQVTCESNKPFQPIGITTKLQDTCSGAFCIKFEDRRTLRSGMQHSRVVTTFGDPKCSSKTKRKYRITIRTFVTSQSGKVELSPVISDERTLKCRISR